MIIVNIILPVFLIIFFGYLLSRLGKVEAEPFSRAQLYILSPALVFIATARADVATTLIFKVFLFISVIALFLFIVSQVWSFAVKGTKPLRHVISLTSMFMNSGFYGIPVCMLAFGEKGFIYAATYVVASSVLQSSVGIFLAASGTNRSAVAVKSVLKVPVLYAIIIARLSAHYNVYPPESFTKILDLLGHSAIPIGLLLLGMQLERIIVSLRREYGGAGGEAEIAPDGSEEEAATGTSANEKEVAFGTLDGELFPAAHEEGKEALLFGSISAALRLGGGLAAALVVLLFMNFDPILKKVLIVEASMPTAVNTVVYATEFRCKPQLAAVAVLVSTLASIVTIPLILKFIV